MWNDHDHHPDRTFDLATVVNEVILRNDPYVWVTGRAEKGVVYVTIENRDPAHVGIREATLVINCGSSTDAADWLAYLQRDFDFDLILRQTYRR